MPWLGLLVQTDHLVALRQRWETRSVRNNKKVRRDEKVREGRLRQELQLHTAEAEILEQAIFSSFSSALCYIFTTSHGRPGNSSFLDNFGRSRLSETRTFKPRTLTKNFLPLTLFPEEFSRTPCWTLLIAIDNFIEGIETCFQKCLRGALNSIRRIFKLPRKNILVSNISFQIAFQFSCHLSNLIVSCCIQLFVILFFF